jgi:hypothetical protein
MSTIIVTIPFIHICTSKTIQRTTNYTFIEIIFCRNRVNDLLPAMRWGNMPEGLQSSWHSIGIVIKTCASIVVFVAGGIAMARERHARDSRRTGLKSMILLVGR